jgi:hypothetical protein
MHLVCVLTPFLAKPIPATSTEPPEVVGDNALNHGGPIELIAPSLSNEKGQQDGNENINATSRRVRKIQTKQAPVPLTATSEAVNKWFEEAHAYLSNADIQLDGWDACIAAWVAFEKENGLVNITSVSVIRISAHLIYTNAQIEESLAGFK